MTDTVQLDAVASDLMLDPAIPQNDPFEADARSAGEDGVAENAARRAYASSEWGGSSTMTAHTHPRQIVDYDLGGMSLEEGLQRDDDDHCGRPACRRDGGPH